MTQKRLAFSIDNGVARICLNRAEAANAIDLAFAKEFEVAAGICASEHVRVICISAEGRQFCVGGDLKSFALESDLGGHLEKVTRHLHNGIAIITELDAPVVVAVNGAAAGAGLGLVCAGDIVVAGSSATFLMAYTKIGLTPDGSTSWFLPQLVGLRRALDMTLTNRILRSDEALSWGIVSRVVADELTRDEADSIVRELAKGPTAALGAAARLVRSAASNSLQSQLAYETACIVKSARSLDGLEGVQAFQDRREPNFGGRK
jgi:2-(1,2-epoxy-1,2-dihydrophenyl)acetyl-CoA isomerase